MPLDGVEPVAVGRPGRCQGGRRGSQAPSTRTTVPGAWMPGVAEARATVAERSGAVASGAMTTVGMRVRWSRALGERLLRSNGPTISAASDLAAGQAESRRGTPRAGTGDNRAARSTACGKPVCQVSTASAPAGLPGPPRGRATNRVRSFRSRTSSRAASTVAASSGPVKEGPVTSPRPSDRPRPEAARTRHACPSLDLLPIETSIPAPAPAGPRRPRTSDRPERGGNRRPGRGGRRGGVGHEHGTSTRGPPATNRPTGSTE